MNKYSPLASYLQALTKNEIRLSFADIEQIIDDNLPDSAREHPAWWANSRTPDSHTWSHLWLRAGWERCEYNLTEQWVTFRRTDEYYEIGSVKAVEGYECDRKVLSRARNTALVAERKARDNNTCQACGFHLQIGEAFVIEVHHLEPLSISGEVETKIENLVSLCPTCHRIAHLRNRPYTVPEIRELLGVT